MTQLVLVTGANGHVGQAIVKELLKRHYKVRATVRDVNNQIKNSALKGLDIELVQADLLDLSSLEQAMNGVAAVFQVAAGYKLHSKNPEDEIRRPALEGTENVLKACHKMGIKKVIYTSSIAAVGVSNDGTPLNEENWNDNAHEYYAMAKRDSERIAWKLAEQYGIKLITILPGGVLGPGFQSHTPTTFIFSKILKNQIPLKLDFALPFVDVRDVAKAHVDALESETCSGRYIVCGPIINFDQVFEVVHNKYPTVKIPTKTVPSFLLPILPFFDWIESQLTGSMRTLTKGVVQEYLTGGKQILDNTRAVQQLNFKPRPIKETIEDTLDWIKVNF